LLYSSSISFQVAVKRLLRNEVELWSSDKRIELLLLDKSPNGFQGNAETLCDFCAS